MRAPTLLKTGGARVSAAAGLMLAAAACAPTHVDTVANYSGSSLPRPDVVVVNDFAASPDNVRLDSGLGARLRGGMSGSSSAAQQTAAAQKVTVAISETLVAELRKRGIPATRGEASTTPRNGNALVVDGQIRSIDEGNRTRRNLIGLGAGRSDVQADAQVYYDAMGREPVLMRSFTADAQSGRKPGAAETMGAGAAANRAADAAAAGVGASVASEKFSANVDAEGKRIAENLAGKLSELYASQGWTPASSIR